jgi:SH3 domain-containing YSC84-like protein 1
MSRQLRIGMSAIIATTLALGADEGSNTNKSSKLNDRLQSAATAFEEIMKIPEKGIPRDLLSKAHCAVIIPGLKKGGFILAAEYGRGFITCRKGAGIGWSAPGNVRIEGGSVGLQAGGGESDLFLLVMNESGKNKLLKSEFKLGAAAGVMAGPVGRTVQADTDARMRAEILGWSRSRGVFAGIALEGSSLRDDKKDNHTLYGKELSNEQIVMGEVKPPAAAMPLIETLTRHSTQEQK